MNELKPGAPIPSVTLLNQKNESIDLTGGDFAKVIYFYPKDDTPGCTLEACSFRDQFSVFEEHGAKVYGVSGDSVKSHQLFAKKHRLNFDLLSDPKGIAEKAFGVKRTLLGLLPGRETFVFSQEGKLIHKFNSAIMATKHVKEAVEALKKART